MCLINSPDPIQPDRPPEVLNQSAPEKKTATPANRLAIGSKKYRAGSIDVPGGSAPKAPTGINLT